MTFLFCLNGVWVLRSSVAPQKRKLSQSAFGVLRPRISQRGKSSGIKFALPYSSISISDQLALNAEISIAVYCLHHHGKITIPEDELNLYVTMNSRMSLNVLITKIDELEVKRDKLRAEARDEIRRIQEQLEIKSRKLLLELLREEFLHCHPVIFPGRRSYSP